MPSSSKWKPLMGLGLFLGAMAAYVAHPLAGWVTAAVLFACTLHRRAATPGQAAGVVGKWRSMASRFYALV